MTETRGFRNNNPGNIRHGSPWVGLATNQNDPDFCTFVDMKYGVRAIAVILKTYGDKGFDTVREIINRWAPWIENNTSAYVAAVSVQMGVDPDIHVEARRYDQMFPLVDAIIHHENGKSCSKSDIDRGLSLAGINP